MTDHQTVWKFPFTVADAFTLDMPRDARVLCVHVQNETPCMWALVFPGNPLEPRRFACFGTGRRIATPGEYVGTFQLLDGRFVGHVFEVEISPKKLAILD